jgi:hypothetical protein
VCRIYFTSFEDVPFFWSVDNGDGATEIKCPGVVMLGSFETVVVPEQQAQPWAWLPLSCPHRLGEWSMILRARQLAAAIVT